MAALKNGRQELFCQQYVVDYNATKAAVRAGYSEKSAAWQGSELLKREDILTRVRELQEEQARRLSLNADFVVKELVTVYRRCMQEEPVMVWDNSQRAYVKSGEYRFDSKGALNALEMIGKHMGMFNLKADGNLPPVGVKVIVDV